MKIRPSGPGSVPGGDPISHEGEPAQQGPIQSMDPRPAYGSEPDGSDAQAWLDELQAKVGRDDVPPEALQAWPSGWVLRHLAALMAEPTSDRDAKVERIAAFLHGTGDPDRVRRWLSDFVQEQPIVDV